MKFCDYLGDLQKLLPRALMGRQSPRAPGPSQSSQRPLFGVPLESYLVVERELIWPDWPLGQAERSKCVWLPLRFCFEHGFVRADCFLARTEQDIR